VSGIAATSSQVELRLVRHWRHKKAPMLMQ
jgi:hypothetical protein